MAARKKAVKKRTRKSSPKRRKTISNHKTVSAHKYNEKMVITAIISILIIGFVVWFSQDFPAQGQAYHAELDLENYKDIATATLTSCQTTGGCEYVLSVIETFDIDTLYLNGEAIDPYQVVYYDATGKEVSGEVTNLVDDGVVTIGHLGTRYNLESLSI